MVCQVKFTAWTRDDRLRQPVFLGLREDKSVALTGRRPAEIFFSASFSLPREKLPFPALLFDGQLKTRQAPGTSFESYLIPVLADPKKIIQALDTLRSLKSFPSPKAVNTTTGPQLPKYVSAASAPLTYPGNQDTSAQPTAPSVATSSNPKTRPTISSSPKSSAVNSSDQTHHFQSDRVIRIFTFESVETAHRLEGPFQTNYDSGRRSRRSLPYPASGSLRRSPAPYPKSGGDRSS
jgi:Telomere resolvase